MLLDKLASIFGPLYEKRYKQMLIVPLVMLVPLLFFIFVYPGITYGIDLVGGNLITVRTSTPIDERALERYLVDNFQLDDLTITPVRTLTGYGVNIRFVDDRRLTDAKKKLAALEQMAASGQPNTAQSSREFVNSLKEFIDPAEYPINSDEPRLAVQVAREAYQEARQVLYGRLEEGLRQHLGLGNDAEFARREISPTLGAVFWNNAIFVAIVAMLLIVGVVFFFFRELIPSFAIIAAASFDILTALGLMSLFRIPLSLASLPALLMLIGYSVDTDILLTTKMFKRRAMSAYERATDALGTGLTMTGTTLGALIIMLILSYLNQITIVFAISTILFFGLIGDIISTWFMNAPVLVWYVKRKEAKKKAK